MLRGGTSEILAFLIHSKISRIKKDIAKILNSRPRKNAPSECCFSKIFYVCLIGCHILNSHSVVLILLHMFSECTGP